MILIVCVFNQKLRTSETLLARKGSQLRRCSMASKVSGLLLEIQRPFIKWVLPLTAALGSTLALVVEQQQRLQESLLELIFGMHTPVIIKIMTTTDGIPRLLWGDEAAQMPDPSREQSPHPGDAKVTIRNRHVTHPSRKVFEGKAKLEVCGIPPVSKIQQVVGLCLKLAAEQHPCFLEGFKMRLPASAQFWSGLFIWNEISQLDTEGTRAPGYRVLHERLPWNLQSIKRLYPSIYIPINLLNSLEICVVDPADESKRLVTLCVSWKALEVKTILTHQCSPADKHGQIVPDGQLVWHDAMMQPSTADLSERCPVTLCGFSSKFTVLVKGCLRLSAFNGSLSLPQWKLGVTGTSDSREGTSGSTGNGRGGRGAGVVGGGAGAAAGAAGAGVGAGAGAAGEGGVGNSNEGGGNSGEGDGSDDNSSWGMEVKFLEYPAHWSDTAVGVFVPIRLIRQLLLEYFVLSLSIVPRNNTATNDTATNGASSQERQKRSGVGAGGMDVDGVDRKGIGGGIDQGVDDHLLRFRLRVRLPALAGCLTRLIKAFVGKEIGSLIVLYRDLFDSFSVDLGYVYEEIVKVEQGMRRAREVVKDGTVACGGSLAKKTRRFPPRWQKRRATLHFVGYKWQLQYHTPTGIVTNPLRS
jgi:hypothetical protein